MSLSVGMSIAQSGLSVSADQTAVVSRNIANANTPGASRKNANVVSAPGGGVRLASITRVSNDALYRAMIAATSVSSGQKAIVDALNTLDTTINDPELDASPAALVQKLNDALQQYSEAPNSDVRARSAVAAAKALATGLNSATSTVQELRAQSDAGMADSVARINTLLSQFETLNNQVINGTRAGTDVTDYQDQRDQVLSSIAEEIGVRAVQRSNGDVALYTDSGVTLFETRARAVTFDQTFSYTAGTTGNAVYVDGVPVTGSGANMAIGSGKLVGLATVRDKIAVTYQSQLDEVARGLVTAFAESDQSATPTLPTIPGLFTYSGAPAMPASGTVSPGLAGSISINASVDPDQGGDVNLLRDGAIGDPGNTAYVYNTSGGAAFSDRLQQLIGNMNAVQSFDTNAQAGGSATLGNYASASVAWLQELRKSAGEEADYRDTVLQNASDSLSKITGVNLDEEMTHMLELERSYQASSKLISTIDSMFDALMAATG
ncbi:MAG: flagellar hook-associated protein FlgK [Hyphomicrobiaceae bacterium]|jgi:flagellar hook-associated protein 1 FlgK